MSVPPWLRQLQHCWFPRFAKSRSGARRAPAHRRIQPCLERLEDRLAPSADLVAVSAVGASTPYSESQQSVTLSADVKDATNSSTTVNEGTVTFTVKDSGGKTVGTAQGKVSNGVATTSPNSSLTLPASEPVGSYTIDVSYSDSASPAKFTDNGTDTTGTLAVSAAATTTTAGTPNPSSVPFSSTNDQTVQLSATVTSSAGTVNEGQVTFKVLQGATVIGTATSGTVDPSTGQASVTYTLPSGTDAGTYTVEADYTDSSPGNFAASTDNSQKLSVTSTTADTTQTTVGTPPTATYSGSAQNVALTATVTDTAHTGTTVNTGSVLFTLLDSNGKVVGTPISGNYDSSSGYFHVSYSLPGGTAAGSYTIEADYSDSSGTFAISSDTSQKLAVGAASTTTTASSASATFSTSTQDVTLKATVTDTKDSGTTVNEGSVQFTLLDSSGKTIGTATSGNVSGGSASVQYALPGGTAAGSYTIEADYSDSSGNNFATSSDKTHSLTVSAASTTTTATSATATFSTSAQNVTLSASVTSGGGTVNEGSVTFTVVDSNGNTVGTATSSAVNNGSARVSYQLPGSTSAGSYTIEAAYSDSAGKFGASSDNTQTLTVSGSNSTILSLTSASINPNLLNATAQVTLTAQVSNPGGTVNEGTVSFTVAGVSAQASVSGGTATVQLSVPIGNVLNGFTVDLSYRDNASSANFTNDSASVDVPTNVWDALLPANLTFDSSENETMQFSLGGLLSFGALYSATTGLLSQINVGSLSLPVVYSEMGAIELASVEGVPWGFIVHDASGNVQGIADVEPAADGSLVFVLYNSNHQQIAELPY
jgi:hypothetical protein